MTKREYVIGRYRLQPGRGLLADDVPLEIGLKAIDILAALVAADGALVTKSELLDDVWPGIVVDEHNIQVHISNIRKALGDDARWIQTIPRRGYRFAGPLNAVRSAGVDQPQTALPRPLTRMFGRERDLAAIATGLERTRLMTISGPGGVGKTRLSLEVASMIGNRYRDGQRFVDLSVLHDPSLIPSAVATAVGIELKGSAAPAGLLANRLAPREMLILLDNCEHLADAVASLSELILARAPLVSLLATSREPLACAGEQVYRLLPLAAPLDGVNSAAEALASPSVAFLVSRLQAADLEFELTDALAAAACAICLRLDGLPLAIEMVGALAPAIGLDVLASRLEEIFRLPYNVARTAPLRHSSLEATLDWSYALLSETERLALRRLAVFPGRFSLEGALAVLQDETMGGAQGSDPLAALVRKSLVSIDTTAAPLSYRLLETIRAYAAEKLEAAGEQHMLRRRHACYVGDVLQRALVDWHAMSDEAWLAQYVWLLDDMRAALSWSFGPDGDRACGFAIVGRSKPLWQVLNLVVEGRRWADIAIAVLDPHTPDDVAARVWWTAGMLTGERAFEHSVPALRKAADLFGRLNAPLERGAALVMLGKMLVHCDGPQSALESLTEGQALMARETRARRLGCCAMALGTFNLYTESWPEARCHFERSRAFFEAAGAERMATGMLFNLADAMWLEGSLSVALETLQEGLSRQRRSGIHSFAGTALGIMSGILTELGELDEALAVAREAVPLCRDDDYLYWLFPHLALRIAKSERPDDAARLLGYANHIIGNDEARHGINERRAIAALQVLLRRTMTPDRIERMEAAGHCLREDQAIALALA
jgi:predicted ATPase/DNA-binding winged helix-turn-helix (wHTH) protein